MKTISQFKLSHLCGLLLTLGLLNGCAYLNNECINYMGKYTCGAVTTNNNEVMAVNPTYSDEGLRTRYSHKMLGHYIEQMTMNMVGNEYNKMTTPIAVASFVQFDSTLMKTNVLGNQIAEGFIHELQQYGLPVVDYKVTGAIRITPKGDFAFSRNVMELASNQSIGYILSGTLVHAKDGVIVNARIVGLSSKVVIASAKGFIPGFVLNAIYSKS